MNRPWNIIFSEISQTQKDKYSIIPFIWGPRIVKFVDTKSRIVVPGTGGKGKGELLFNECRGFCGDDEKILGIDSGDSYKTLWTTKNPQNFVNIFNILTSG